MDPRLHKPSEAIHCLSVYSQREGDLVTFPIISSPGIFLVFKWAYRRKITPRTLPDISRFAQQRRWQLFRPACRLCLKISRNFKKVRLPHPFKASVILHMCRDSRVCSLQTKARGSKTREPRRAKSTPNQSLLSLTTRIVVTKTSRRFLRNSRTMRRYTNLSARSS
jgi:hypothetical protein